MCTPTDRYEIDIFVAAAMLPGLLNLHVLEMRQPWSALVVLALLVHLTLCIVGWRELSPEAPLRRLARPVGFGLALGVAAVVLLELLA
jgi:hypothetical protein